MSSKKKTSPVLNDLRLFKRLAHSFKKDKQITSEKPIEKLVEKPTQKPVQIPIKKINLKPFLKPAKKPTERPAMKLTEKPDKKPTEKPVTKPSEKNLQSSRNQNRTIVGELRSVAEFKKKSLMDNAQMKRINNLLLPPEFYYFQSKHPAHNAQPQLPSNINSIPFNIFHRFYSNKILKVHVNNANQFAKKKHFNSSGNVTQEFQHS